jgi:methyl-accepting chemotaxis protein
MTLRQKLFLLAGINVLLTVAVGFIGFWGILRLDPSNSPVTSQMTAVRASMQVDMMHDALRADVLRALLISTTGNALVGSESDVTGDLGDHNEIMKAAIEQNKNLPLSAARQADLAAIAEPVASYQKSAKSIVSAAFRDPKAAIDSLPAFMQLFSELEGSLERTSSGIEGESKETFMQEVASARWMRSAILGVICFAALIGLGVSSMVVKSVLAPMKKALDDLAGTARELNQQADTLTESASDLNAASNEQSAAVQESVAAISEILSMVSQTTNFSEQSISSSSQMTERTQEGSRIINRLSGSIGSIQQANAQLMEMANIIQEISNKTGVINDIVFKTQLLSFNASIEAARAGQHGRGFAVVAEEVGNLAEMSGSSAREIQSLLEDSKKQVSLIVDSVQKRVAEGEQVTSEAVAIFNRISAETGNLNGFINRIGEATKEQETGIHQISTAMSQVGTSAQKNLSSATQTSHASKRLAKQSANLARVVSSLESLLFGGGSVKAASSSTAGTPSTRNRYLKLTEEFHSELDVPEGVPSFRASSGQSAALADDESFRPYGA